MERDDTERGKGGESDYLICFSGTRVWKKIGKIQFSLKSLIQKSRFSPKQRWNSILELEVGHKKKITDNLWGPLKSFNNQSINLRLHKINASKETKLSESNLIPNSSLYFNMNDLKTHTQFGSSHPSILIRFRFSEGN